jgi:hypothetical protein
MFLLFATSFVDTSGKFATVINNTIGTIPVAKFAASVNNASGKFATGGAPSNVIFRGLGKDYS